jgi:hypothetical protein
VQQFPESSDCGDPKSRRGISSIFSNKFEWPVPRSPGSSCKYSKFLFQSVFPPSFHPVPLASHCERSCLRLPSSSPSPTPSPRSHFVPTEPRVAVAEGRKEGRNNPSFARDGFPGERRGRGKRKKEGTLHDFHRGGGGRGDRCAGPISNLEILETRAVGGEFRRDASPHPAMIYARGKSSYA